jgi:energy-coupling factor transporter ATP-binding protein EcfA2
MIAQMDAETVTARLSAARRLLRALDGTVPADRLAPLRTTVERVQERLELPNDHVVIALAGTTGSGKSSIFNALAGVDLSAVGVRRPTTSAPHACVWQPHTAGAMLEWLGVPLNRRFDREPGPAGDDTGGDDTGEPDPLAKLSGLILLDLPDFDSLETAHRVEVDRLLSLVDQVIWVVDPQKYADEMVHEKYLRPASRHGRIAVVALNKIETLDLADGARCVADLRRLLDEDGMSATALIATSTIAPGALDELRGMVVRCSGALRYSGNGEGPAARLADDLASAVAELAPLVSPDLGEDVADRASVGRLIELLSVVAGVPAAVEAAERGYRRRAEPSTRWPITRLLRRLRPDPLRGLDLPPSPTGTQGHAARHSPHAPGDEAAEKATARHARIAADPDEQEATAQRVAARLAARELVDRSAGTLPDPWRAAAAAAALASDDEIPAALDVAVGRVALWPKANPSWWRAVAAAHWVAAGCVVGSTGWLIVRYVLLAIGAATLPAPLVGPVSAPVALLAVGALFGLLLAAAVRPLVGFSARRARRKAQRRLRAAVAEVASDLVVAPLRGVLRQYRDARAAFKETSREDPDPVGNLPHRRDHG